MENIIEEQNLMERQAPVAKSEIRKFKFKASEKDLKDLKKRIEATRWPDQELVKDGSQGVQRGTMQKLARYWSTEYDWRKIEAKLNSYPQFITTIDGLDIHFIHVKSKHENALPVIITHGWPGSIIEQLKIIEPLTDPTRFGGKAEDAFDVVIPSMPGYGFSGKPTEVGWGPAKIADTWITLMRNLGYEKFVAQGGDWGALITEVIGSKAPKELLGIHTNMPQGVPDEILQAAQTGAPMPAGFSADEKRAYEQLVFFLQHIGYAIFMGTRPQSLTALADSPVGLATFMLDHDARSYEMIARAFDGVSEGLSRDDVLDNITLTWLTNTAVSSARLYWENKYVFFKSVGVKVPIAVSAFPDELYQAPRSWMERAYPKLIHYNRLPKGGHFAAWEQPESLVSEMREGLRSLRSGTVVH